MSESISTLSVSSAVPKDVDSSATFPSGQSGPGQGNISPDKVTFPATLELLFSSHAPMKGLPVDFTPRITAKGNAAELPFFNNMNSDLDQTVPQTGKDLPRLFTAIDEQVLNIPFDPETPVGDSGEEAVYPGMHWSGVMMTQSGNQEQPKFFSLDFPEGETRPILQRLQISDEMLTSAKPVSSHEIEQALRGKDGLSQFSQIWAKQDMTGPDGQSSSNTFTLALAGQSDRSMPILLPATHTELAAVLTQNQATTIAAAQPAMTTSTTSPGALVQPPPIPVPPDHTAWADSIGERVQWLVGRNLQQADIHLHPPELGSLDVRIKLNPNDNQASVTFSTPHAQVKEALEAAIPRLREMLSQNGLDLGDVDVSQHSFGDQHPQGEQTDNESLAQRGTRSDNQASPEGEEIINTARQIETPIQHHGVLDMYA